MNVVDKINLILKQANISKVNLAKYLGVSRQMVYNYLDGDDLSKLPNEKLQLLLKLLNVKSELEIEEIDITNEYIQTVGNKIFDSKKVNSRKNEVIELSGLRKEEEYFIQKADTVEGRPDAIVKLPENKCVMIDAKTSLASFSAYLQAESEEEKLQHLKEFKDSTKSHIAGLTKRDYKPSDESLSPEYILMFIPIESCYSLMFCDDNYLWDLAWKNHIMPVSPSTLLASLKIINAFLVVNRQNENAQEISRLATKMLDKFSDMVKNIRQAREKIDTGLKQLDGRDSIIVNAEKMTELGAKINKPLPEPENRE